MPSITCVLQMYYDPFRLLAVDVVEEFALVVFVLKLAPKESRSGFAIRIANPAGSYTHVIGIHHDTNVFGAQNALKFFSDLDR